jgi:hypothetical protein
MSAELPFAITFELPEHWMLVAPESCGHPEAAYVAVREYSAPQPIATNFVVNGFAGRGAPLDVGALADSYLAKTRSQYPVVVLKRDVMTGESATEAAQLLEIEYPVADSTVTVNQIQIINVFPGAQDRGATAVLQLLLTCPAAVFDQAGREFTQIVATISALPTPGSQQ